MTDEELLRAAAKAAGIDLAWSSNEDQSPRSREGWNVWNPLTNSGDALELAVKLGIEIDPRLGCVYTGTERIRESFDATDEGGYAATRRAIVRAAAALSDDRWLTDDQELGAEHFGAEGK